MELTYKNSRVVRRRFRRPRHPRAKVSKEAWVFENPLPAREAALSPGYPGFLYASLTLEGWIRYGARRLSRVITGMRTHDSNLRHLPAISGRRGLPILDYAGHCQC